MRIEEREDPNPDQRPLTDDTFYITILPNGEVVLPQIDDPLVAEIAKALGDEKAEEFCEQASLTKVHVGKRMCG